MLTFIRTFILIKINSAYNNQWVQTIYQMLFSIKISAFNEYENKMIKIKCLSCFLFYCSLFMLCYPSIHPSNTNISYCSSRFRKWRQYCKQRHQDVSPRHLLQLICGDKDVFPSQQRDFSIMSWVFSGAFAWQIRP